MSRILAVKLHPNEELYAGLEAACRKAGVRHAVVVAGIGSLNDAWFLCPSPGGGPAGMQCVRGPGLEVAGLNGEIVVPGEGAGESSLTGWITRADTSVTGGVLVRDRNIVCITYEVVMQEWAPDA